MKAVTVKALNNFTALSDEELEKVDGGGVIAVAVIATVLLFACAAPASSISSGLYHMLI